MPRKARAPEPRQGRFKSKAHFRNVTPILLPTLNLSDDPSKGGATIFACESAVDGAGGEGAEEEDAEEEEAEEGEPLGEELGGKEYFHDRPLGIHTLLPPHPKPSLNTAGAGVCLSMWEFGQNDPNRDSGSKLKRLGFARYFSPQRTFSIIWPSVTTTSVPSVMRLGTSFPGIVLSSEAKVFASPADVPVVEKFGIAGEAAL